MTILSARSQVARFGVFELDARSSELRRNGMRVRLADQPIQILQLLLEHPGHLVTREQLRERLWSSGTYVDFDLGLNSAVRKLREALGDSAENPRFIETLPRRGYRFIAPVSANGFDDGVEPPADGTANDGISRSRNNRAKWIAAAVCAVAVPTLAVVYARAALDHPRDVEGVAAASVVSASERSALRPRRSADVRAVDPAAYNLFIAGVRTAGRQTYEQFRDASEYFARAIERQPDFAEAHAGLATMQLQYLFTGPLSPYEAIPKAEAEARKAIELDETLAQPHRTLGIILHAYYWKWDEGDRELRRARELNRSSDRDETATFIRTRRFGEAIVSAERARERNARAFETYHNLALAYRANGEFDRALAEMRRGLELFPDLPRAHFELGATLALSGRPRDAIPEFERAVAASLTRNPRFQAYLGYAYAAAGRTGAARRVLDSLATRARQQYVSSYGIALIYDALGEKDRALAAFERAFDERAVEFSQFANYPSFKTIGAEPAFLQRMSVVGW
jgi:DNA-binding winged helix-turn-helix (wHTH) protein/Tfp pilus assembly protein PilF